MTRFSLRTTLMIVLGTSIGFAIIHAQIRRDQLRLRLQFAESNQSSVWDNHDWKPAAGDSRLQIGPPFGLPTKRSMSEYDASFTREFWIHVPDQAQYQVCARTRNPGTTWQPDAAPDYTARLPSGRHLLRWDLARQMSQKMILGLWLDQQQVLLQTYQTDPPLLGGYYNLKYQDITERRFRVNGICRFSPLPNSPQKEGGVVEIWIERVDRE